MIWLLIVKEVQPAFLEMFPSHFNHLSPKRVPDSLQAHTEARGGGLEDLTWRYSSVLPGWGESLPGFPEPANLELEECRETWVLCPAASPAAVQVTPAHTLLLLPCRRRPRASVPESVCAPLYPCLQEGLKIVMESYTQELNPVGTCRVNTVKPECLPSRSWSVLRRLLGHWFMLPVFPTHFPGNAPRKPETPLPPPPQTTGYRNLEAHRVCFFILHEHLWWKKDTFNQRGQICFFH